MTKTTKRTSLRELLEATPRIAARLREAEYLGACIVQAPGAWARMGPTWLHPRLGWIVAGPGIDTWGTTRGLAELASSDTASPTWHAVGIAVAPTPNLVFGVSTVSLAAPYAAEVRALAAEADELAGVSA
jgi:hypothetical protein